LTIAGMVVAACLVLLFAMVGLNAWACVTGTFAYPIPESIVALITSVFFAATTILTLSGILSIRAEKIEHRREKQFEAERTPTVRPGTYFVTPEEKPRYEKAAELIAEAEIISDSSLVLTPLLAAKVDTINDLLDDIYPLPEG